MPQAATSIQPDWSQRMKNIFVIKAVFVLFFFVLVLGGGSYGEILRSVLVEAYLAVAVFVSFTLCLVYGLERIFKFNIGHFNRAHPKSQVAVAAGLGVLPGCGGAIVVLTQYVSGHIGFGSVVAVLISTMGDAAFLLLAKEPLTAALVMSISFCAAVISGMLVDKIHGRDFMRIVIKPQQEYKPPIVRGGISRLEKLCSFSAFMFFVPGFILGILLAFQISLSEGLQQFFGLVGIFALLGVWVFLKDRNPMVNYATEIEKSSIPRRVMDETAFIIIWVIAAFFLYEALVYAFDIDLKALFSSVVWMLPLFGVMIGFIPGCGPQIIVTTLYLNGVVPLSVQLGNAISNDGDALFPAIALAPKAALLATLYSGIPAVMVAYTYFLWFEF